jgi:uncharacterized protein with ATP-grasp and redox domains
MKINLDCIPCFQRQALRAMRMNFQDEETQKRILKLIMKKLMKMDWSLTPPDLAREVYKIIRRETGVNDLYKEAKKACNDTALKLLPKIKKEINNSKDSLETAIRISIAGNIMDFGPHEKFNIEKTINKILSVKFAINDYQKLKEKIGKAKSLLFFTDNAGEIVFDKLLIETILNIRKKSGNKNLKITMVVKGGPIMNDATILDVKYIGMDKIPNIEFKTINNGDSGTGPLRNSSEVKSWIKNHDLVISKGQGNYEGLSQFRNICFLLIAKCNVIASDLGVNQGGIILKCAK